MFNLTLNIISEWMYPFTPSHLFGLFSYKESQSSEWLTYLAVKSLTLLNT